jgi:hypothetical protein
MQSGNPCLPCNETTGLNLSGDYRPSSIADVRVEYFR